MTRVRQAQRGFTLVELAVVAAIVGLLLGGLMYTLAAQTEQRSFDETRRRLDLARELVLAFAVVNGRLPCPARAAATAAPVTVAGDEVRDTTGATANCTGDGTEDFYGGVSAGGVQLGLLPARTIGFPLVDAAGFAVDAWNNRLRYAVARLKTNCAANPLGLLDPHFVDAAAMRRNGLGCQPSDLIICRSATGITASTCGGGANQLTAQDLIAVIIFSTGKNSASVAAPGADEAANLNGDRVFVWHTPTPDGAANGEFDDQFVWIPVGELYARLVAAGKMP
jgi:prepilin-type N-terminal cleavage/methylation domain-containing protein